MARGRICFVRMVVVKLDSVVQKCRVILESCVCVCVCVCICIYCSSKSAFVCVLIVRVPHDSFLGGRERESVLLVEDFCSSEVPFIKYVYV